MIEDIDNLKKCVANASCKTEAVKALGWPLQGAYYRKLLVMCNHYNICIDHFPKVGYKKVQKLPLDEILVENSSRLTSHSLKLRLLREGVLENRCYICNLPPLWEGADLSLQLDHKNGIRDDNRLENLRILCPNCHSQTDTFSGKHNKGKNKTSNICTICKQPTNNTSELCKPCKNMQYSLSKKESVLNIQAAIEFLKSDLTLEEIGIRWGNITPNSVIKRCKKLGLDPSVDGRRLLRAS